MMPGAGTHSLLEVFTGTVRGHIYIFEGNIVHAESGNLQGEVGFTRCWDCAPGNSIFCLTRNRRRARSPRIMSFC